MSNPTVAQGPRILIVEDNLNNFKLMARALAYQGITRCEWKTSGAQALEFASSLPQLDLILIDIFLPGEDGYQVLARLRAQPRFASTRIVAISADTTTENIERARQAGFDGFISKPINVSRFPEQVNKILQGQAVWE